jgi:hypothetical protein
MFIRNCTFKYLIDKEGYRRYIKKEAEFKIERYLSKDAPQRDSKRIGYLKINLSDFIYNNV